MYVKLTASTEGPVGLITVTAEGPRGTPAGATTVISPEEVTRNSVAGTPANSTLEICQKCNPLSNTVVPAEPVEGIKADNEGRVHKH